MSRQLHLVEITDQQLQTLHKARIAAAAVLVILFTLVVAFAPANEVHDTTPAMTAAAPATAEAEAP